MSYIVYYKKGVPWSQKLLHEKAAEFYVGNVTASIAWIIGVFLSLFWFGTLAPDGIGWVIFPGGLGAVALFFAFIYSLVILGYSITTMPELERFIDEKKVKIMKIMFGLQIIFGWFANIILAIRFSELKALTLQEYLKKQKEEEKLRKQMQAIVQKEYNNLNNVGGIDIINQLKELKRMLDEKTITIEEFEKLKNDLINNTSSENNDDQQEQQQI